VDVRHIEGLGEALGGDASVPIMAVEELVLNQPVPLDEAEHVFGPLAEVLDEMLLAEEVAPAAGRRA
jgi:hypothetical protein